MQFHVENLAFSRNDIILFEKLDFVIQAGECLQICGPNGSGKSTLLKILTGIIEKTEGNIFIRKSHTALKENINYIGHHNAVRSYLTVFENIKLFLSLHKQQRTSTEIKDVLRKWQLPPESPCLNLSAGQLRRTALTKIDLIQKPIWLLDEPMNSLDEMGKILFLQSLETHLSLGGLAVIATHDLITHGLITHDLKKGSRNNVNYNNVIYLDRYK